MVLPAQIAILEEAEDMFADTPDGKPPDDRRVSEAMLKLVDVAEQLVHGQAELRSDVTDLKAGQAELRADVKELQKGQAALRATVDRLDGNVGDLRGVRYEKQFRDRLPILIQQACRENRFPQPEDIVLEWDDNRRGNHRAWAKLVDELKIDPNSRLHDCDFLFRIEWPPRTRLPDLWLAGAISTTIDKDLLTKIAGHRHDLEAANEVRTLAVGAGFTKGVRAQGGPAAVAAAGAHWVSTLR